MKIPVKLTISRPQYGDGRRAISICIIDEASGIEFFDGEIGLAEFASALTGLSWNPMEAELRGLEYIGKTRVSEPREILCPIKDYERETLSKWLEDNAQEEGWLLNTYLGSQGSVSPHEGGQRLRYSVTKYVAP